MFEVLGWITSIVFCGFVLLWLVNRKAARSIWTSGRAQVGKLGSAALAVDPKAIFEQEIRDAKEELNHSITDLEESQGLVTELQEQVKGDQRKVVTLDAKIKASLKDNPKDTNGKAAEWVMQMETAQVSLDRNTEQLNKAQTLYSNNLKKFQLAQKKIWSKEEHGRQLGAEVKSSEMNARLARLAQKFNVDVSALDSRLGEAEAEMQKKIAQNNAVSKVQTDLGINELAQAEEEDRLARLEAKNKLNEYRKKMGLENV